MSHIEHPLFWCQHLLARPPAGWMDAPLPRRSFPQHQEVNGSVSSTRRPRPSPQRNAPCDCIRATMKPMWPQRVRALRVPPGEHDDRRSHDEAAAGGAHLNAGLVSWRRAVLRCCRRESIVRTRPHQGLLRTAVPHGWPSLGARLRVMSDRVGAASRRHFPLVGVVVR